MLALTGHGCGDLRATSLPRCTWAHCAITQPPQSPAGHVGGAHLAAKSAPQGPGGMARVPGELCGGAPGRNPPCCLCPHVQTRGHTCSVASSLSKRWLLKGGGTTTLPSEPTAWRVRQTRPRRLPSEAASVRTEVGTQPCYSGGLLSPCQARAGKASGTGMCGRNLGHQRVGSGPLRLPKGMSYGSSLCKGPGIGKIRLSWGNLRWIGLAGV